MPENFAWKVEASRRNGTNLFETAGAEVDPWSILAAKMLSLRLAADGWRPIDADEAMSIGEGEGWANLTRIATEVGGVRSERFTLGGNISFVNADRNVILYVALISGKVEQRKTVEDALAHVAVHPAGLRWVGNIVPSGPNLRERVANIEREVVTRYRRLVGDTGWVQVPFYTRSGQLRMSETKIKAVLAGEPPRQTPRGGKVKLQVRGSRGTWRAIGARPMELGPAGLVIVGPHSFTTCEKDGFVYLTATGAVEPTYRLPMEEYLKWKGVSRVEKAVR